MDNPDTIQTADTGHKSRRGLVAALGLGGTAAALALSARPAQAQETTDTSTPAAETPTTEMAAPTGAAPTTEPVLIATATQETVVAATATTTPPRKVQPEDRPFIAAAKVLELTAAAAYAQGNARITDLGLDEAQTALLAALEAHHRAYAEALSAAYGPGSPADANPALLAKIGGDTFNAGTGNEILAAAMAIEHAASDTHQTLLGVLRSTNAAALVASIQVMEARHGATLAVLLGQARGADGLGTAIDDAAGALSAADITGGN